MQRFNRLLLTGAAGGLGRELRHTLKPCAEILRVSDSAPLGAAGFGEEVVTCDLADKAQVHDLLAGVDAIGNPAIWWTSLAAVGWALWAGLKRRKADWLFAAVAFGFMYLPWAVSPRILNYSHYYFEAIPYAILAITLGDYMSTILSLGPYSSYLWALIAITAVSALNLLGIRESTRVHNAMTVLEVLGIVAIVYAGFSVNGINSMGELLARQSRPTEYGLAMVFVLLTFGGWNEVSYLSAEMRDKRRGISRALVWGLGGVTLLYLLANLAYLHALGLPGMAQSNAVASDVFTLAFGKG